MSFKQDFPEVLSVQADPSSEHVRVSLHTGEVFRIRSRVWGTLVAYPGEWAKNLAALREGSFLGETLNAAKHEPPPVPNESQPIYELVMADIEARAQEGKKKYGTYIQATNGRNALMDAYQEALDLAMYLRQKLEEDAPSPVSEGLALQAGRASEKSTAGLDWHDSGGRLEYPYSPPSALDGAVLTDVPERAQELFPRAEAQLRARVSRLESLVEGLECSVERLEAFNPIVGN